MSPDTTAGGFPAFLGLVQYSAATVVISVMIDVEREQVEKYQFKNEWVSVLSFFSPEHQARQALLTQMTPIVQNDQAARYKPLKRSYLRLSCLV